MKELITHFRSHAAFEIADYMLENEMIDESFHSNLTGDLLTEDSIPTPDSASGVPYKVFRSVWDNPAEFTSYKDMYAALFPGRVNPPKGDSQAKAIRRILSHFQKYQNMSDTYANQQERVDAYVGEITNDEEKEAKQGNNIFPGSKSKKESRKIQQINDSELFSGTFYTDRTKISPRRWYAWWKVWKQRKESVPPNDVNSLLDLFAKRWEKYFVLGYQVGRNQTFEIWYNTYNSSFTVHDGNGNSLTQSVPNVRQAVKGLFTIAAQVDKTDIDFLKKVDAGIEAAFSQSVSAAVSDAEKESDKREDQRKREQEKKQKKAQSDVVSKVRNSQAYKDFTSGKTRDDEEETDFRQKYKQPKPDGGDVSDYVRRKTVGWKQFPVGGEYSPPTWSSTRTDVTFGESAVEVVIEEQKELSPEELTSPDMNPLYNQQAVRRAEAAMSQSDDKMTKELLSKSIIGEIKQYDETKFNMRPSLFKTIFKWMFPFKSRQAPIEEPIKFRGLLKRAKGSFYGADVRADFVTGFSLGAVDLEIWYVQELDLYDTSGRKKSFSVSKQRASYYVYDVKSKQIIAKNIPYYRLALQTIFLKMGAPLSDL